MNISSHIKTLISFLSFLLIPALLWGETPEASDYDNNEIKDYSRPVTGIYSIEIGHKNLLATYLSPLKYTGTTYSFSGEWMKAMPFNPEHAVMRFSGDASFSNLLNPAKTARMIGLEGGFSWGMAWRTMIPADIQLTVGGEINLTGGAYYLLRNGNNPVQAMANASLGIVASLGRPFKLGSLPILVRDFVSIPSVGAFFAPEYGETYYEIYLGNHKGLAHAGWWGNNFRIDNLLSLTFDFGRTAATIGYRFNATTQWANSLNTKIYTHSIVIGVIPGGIGLKKSSKSLQKSIYSLY